jgi:hypothetical protein
MVDNVRVPADGAGKRITTNIYNDGANDYHTQVVSIGDRTNPNVQQTVNPDGSALVEFATGAPQFDAFNRMLMSTDDLMSAIKFYDGPASTAVRIQEETFGNASIFFDPAIRGYTVRTDPGAGNRAVMQTHRHFPYRPGSSYTTYFVVAGNEPAQTNVSRRVGLFNENDGLYMEMEDGVIYCVIRNSLTGTERRVPQNQWNRDRLDGSGDDFNRSGAQLNPTAMNIFAINYQYLSAGAVNFFTFVGGKQILIHQFSNYGELDRPYMGTTKLPFRCEIENTGSGQVGTTDIYIFCAALVSQGYNDDIKVPIGFEATKTITSSTEVPLLAFRPSQTYFGEDNRNRYLLATISGFSTSEPVMVSIRGAIGTITQDPLLGATWGETKLGLELDTTAVAFYPGMPDWGKLIIPAGQNQSINILAIGGDSSTDGLYRNANVANSEVWLVTAHKLTDDGGNTDVTVYGTMYQLEH